MIELKTTKYLSNSATMIAISNFNSKHVNVGIIDLKTRKQDILMTFKNKERPTFLFQVNENYLMVGTEGGFIEYWSLNKEEGMKDVYEAHKES